MTCWLATGHTCDDKAGHTAQGLVALVSEPDEREWRELVRRGLHDKPEFLDLLENEVGGLDNRDEPQHVK